MHVPSASNPLLHWDPAAHDPAQRRIHPMLRGAVLGRDGWTCSYCGGEATEVDHVEPRARGGATTPTNLVATCRRCNKTKGVRTPWEWRRDEAMERLLAQVRRRRARRRHRAAGGAGRRSELRLLSRVVPRVGPWIATSPSCEG